eukprot:10243010-Alexandrium_andersonii.AAC.1
MRAMRSHAQPAGLSGKRHAASGPQQVVMKIVGRGRCAVSCARSPDRALGTVLSSGGLLAICSRAWKQGDPRGDPAT